MNNASLKSLGGHMVSFFLDSYLGVKLLGHMVTLRLTFEETAILFSKVIVPLHIPTSEMLGVTASSNRYVCKY